MFTVSAIRITTKAVTVTIISTVVVMVIVVVLVWAESLVDFQLLGLRDQTL